MDIKMISFQQHGDDRGNLVVAEFGKEIPFVTKRIYYIYGVSDNKRRGFHSHRNLKQIYIAITGNCKVMLTNGKETEEIVLNKPYEGLYIGHDIWREIYDFSADCTLMVLASDVFLESDYIRKYDEYIKDLQDRKVFCE